MSGIDRNGHEVILLEMKFYAGITENQPNGYLERLIKENGKALAFVCPEQRRVSLWSKIKELCIAAGRGMKASANRNGYIRYMKTDKYQIALIYSRKAWMSKSSVETPFWFYLDDDGWKQSDHMKARLNAIPENQREWFNYDVGIALHALTDAPLDDVANNLMEQILKFIESLEKNS